MTEVHLHPQSAYMEQLYLPACTQLPEHSHSVDIDLTLLRGRVYLYRTGRSEWLAPGDRRFIPAGQMHSLVVGLQDCVLGLTHHFEEPVASVPVHRLSTTRRVTV